MLTVSKPAPDIYLKACAELGTDPRTAYAVEDSYNGIRAAHAAGMTPIMVPDMVPANDEMHERSAIILPDLLAVRDWLMTQPA
jgi:beta-phosphoglucomutase-like phosphatase (HAD superfamily)